MSQLVNTILVFLILTGFLLLASSRLVACIRAVAIQGVLLGLLAIAARGGSQSVFGVVLPLTSAMVKGFILPWLITRAMRDADTAREIEPLISYNLSVIVGAVALGVSLWLGQRLPLPNQPTSFLLVPAAFFTCLVGFVLLTTRRKAITQVLGFLTLENGVYTFGAAVALDMPVLVELGILLDVFVAVFVMGIAIFHISRQFDHIDTGQLVALGPSVMIVLLLLIPTLAGAAAFFIASDPLRRGLLVSVATAQFALSVGTWLTTPAPALGGWLAEDALSRLFLTLTSLLFLASSFYAVAYLRDERGKRHSDSEEGFLFSNAREASFTGCLLIFLAAMTLVTLSQQLALLWVAVEATTLASAPLIYFHRHHRSLEATWKYLLICSVGIALALLGIFFLAVAATSPGSTAVSLVLNDLLPSAPRLNPLWLKAAFVLMLVGYGTKMGLAPFHTWLPDAHSEAPSVASALLSGALLNCAFLAILRIHQICVASGLADFSERLLVVLGMISMAVAAIFITGQVDYKRMLAYSSVEHMGILAVGVGLGGAGLFGAMLHVINHSLTKVMLFMVAGNLLAVYHTKTAKSVSGALHVLPVSGSLWVLGFLAITGSPPFGPFLSEFTILKAAFDQGRPFVAITYLILLAIILAGMATPVLAMAQGIPREDIDVPAGRSIALTAVPAILGAGILLMGIYIPPVLSRTIHEAARLLGPR